MIQGKYQSQERRQLEYRVATLDDLDLLTASRVKVLRAANKLDDSVDMTEVEKESYNYYKKALVV